MIDSRLTEEQKQAVIDSGGCRLRQDQGVGGAPVSQDRGGKAQR